MRGKIKGEGNGWEWREGKGIRGKIKLGRVKGREEVGKGMEDQGMRKEDEGKGDEGEERGEGRWNRRDGK